MEKDCRGLDEEVKLVLVRREKDCSEKTPVEKYHSNPMSEQEKKRNIAFPLLIPSV